MEKDIVVFIHGTFAKEANWMKTDSKIYKALSKYFHIYLFNWSGKNSHIARHFASKELSIFIKDLINNNQNKKINIISHSHGGNVVLKSLKYLHNDIDYINKIICLGTPFISVSAKEIPITMSILSFIFSMTLYYGIIFFFIYIFSFFIDINEKNMFINFIFISILGISIYFQNKVFNFLQEKVSNIWNKIFKCLENFYSPKIEKKVNVFYAYTNKDEAFKWLNFSEQISSYIQNKYFINKEIIQTILLLISIVYIGFISIKDINFQNEDFILDILVKFFIIFLVSSIITFLLYHLISYILRLINYFLSSLLTNHPFSFGLDNILGIIFVRVLVKKSPINSNYNLTCKEYKFKKDNCQELLLHSCFYNNNEVINDIIIYLDANKFEERNI